LSCQNLKLLKVIAVLTALENRHPNQSTQARNLLWSMLQTGADHFSSHNPSSTEITGVLTKLVDLTETELASNQNKLSEVTAGGAKLVKNLSGEITAATAAYAVKIAKLSELNEEVSTSKVTKAATEKTLATAKAELAELKNKQAVTEHTYAERVADRNTEMTTIADTIGILNSDQAFRARVKTQGIAPPPDVFLQLRSVRRSITPAQRAENLLRQVPSLSFLATQVHASRTQLYKVYEAMDQLAAELQKQQAVEVANKDKCVEQIQESDTSLDEVGAALSQIAKNLDATRDRQSAAAKLVEKNSEDVAHSKTSMRKLTDIRSVQNADFIDANRELRDTIYVLQQAIHRLSATYESSDFIQQDKKEVDNIRFIQVMAHEAAGDGQEPPKTFEKYMAKDVSNSPLRLLREILGNFEKAVADSVREEQDLQHEYEASVKSSTKFKFDQHFEFDIIIRILLDYLNFATTNLTILQGLSISCKTLSYAIH
jgi:hypothetical protein